MRTSIELKPEHQGALLALAARCGQKGLSGVLSQAIDAYLSGEAQRERKRQILRELAGCLSPDEADSLRRAVRDLRESW